MKHHAALILAAAFLAGCGGTRQAAAPIYDLRATPAPLTYSAVIDHLTIIETPGGVEHHRTTSLVLSLAYGSATAEGLPFEVVFSEAPAEDGPVVFDLSTMIGVPFRGVVLTGGDLELTDVPELDIPGYDASTIEELISPLVIPLPPEGHALAEPWPLERSSDPAGGLTGVVTFDGSARIAADSVWNEIPSAVVIVSGEVKVRALGTPVGAPGELEQNMEGDSESTYAWDPTRGIVLGVDVTTEMDGSLEFQGMIFPISTESTATYSLVE